MFYEMSSLTKTTLNSRQIYLFSSNEKPSDCFRKYIEIEIMNPPPLSPRNVLALYPLQK
jgi:hypothetical protein